MVTFSNPRRWSWQWSWTACTEESATRASTQTQSSSTRRSASFLFVRKVLKVFKNIFQGAGRVAFSNQQSYIAAISARFVQLQHGEIDKRVEVGRMKIIESKKYPFFKHFLFFFFLSYNNSHQRWNHTSLTTSYATSVRVEGIQTNWNSFVFTQFTEETQLTVEWSKCTSDAVASLRHSSAPTLLVCR